LGRNCGFEGPAAAIFYFFYVFDVFDVKTLKRERLLHWLMRTVTVPIDELKELGRMNVVLLGDAVHVQPILAGDGRTRPSWMVFSLRR
jgi:hypothetical protein